jgi:hypothetical protein
VASQTTIIFLLIFRIAFTTLLTSISYPSKLETLLNATTLVFFETALIISFSTGGLFSLPTYVNLHFFSSFTIIHGMILEPCSPYVMMISSSLLINSLSPLAIKFKLSVAPEVKTTSFSLAFNNLANLERTSFIF